jgi:hypothetical protein
MFRRQFLGFKWWKWCIWLDINVIEQKCTEFMALKYIAWLFPYPVTSFLPQKWRYSENLYPPLRWRHDDKHVPSP